MLPASEPARSLFLKTEGGAKSSDVNVPDLRSICLQEEPVSKASFMGIQMHTYGLGITARSSKDVASGTCAFSPGLYGLGDPSGLSGVLPFCRSLYDVGGAKSIGLKTM